jgi:hypothetical protein
MKRKHTEKKSTNRGGGKQIPYSKDWQKGWTLVAENILKMAQKRNKREREAKQLKTA